MPSRVDCQQVRTTNATTATTPAFLFDPNTGDTVVVWVSSWRASGGTTHQAPTDVENNTYTQIGTTQASSSGDFQLSCWRSENVVGGGVFTVTGNVATASTITVIAVLLSGPAIYNGDTVGATGTSTSADSGTSSPAPSAASYFLAAVTKGATGSVTAGSGWQFFTNSTQTDNVTFQDLYVEELTAGTSSSAQNGTFSLAGSENWLARVVSFGPSPAATLDQYAYRLRNNDGSETTATWKAAQNTSAAVAANAVVRVRVGINATGTPNAISPKLQYRKVGAASWRDVDITPIAFQFASNAGGGSNSSLTWSHTCAGSNRLLIVGVATPDVLATSVTFNGVALTRLDFDDFTGPIHGEFWYLVGPDPVTANLVLTLPSTTGVTAGATSYTGVNQNTPFGTHAKAEGNAATVSVVVSSAVGQVVHDCVAVRTGTTTISAGAGQTSRWNRLAAGTPPGTLPIGAGSSELGAASVTMSWAVDDAVAKPFVTIAAPILPANVT